MRFSNLQIGVRLGAGFAVVFLFLLIVAFTGWRSLAQVKAHSDVIVLERNVKVELASNMRRDVNDIAKAARDYLIYTDPGTLNLQLGRIVDANKRIEDAIAKSAPLLRGDTERKAIDDIDALRKVVLPLVDNVTALVDAGKPDEAKEFLRENVQKPQDKWLKAIQAHIDTLKRQNEEAIEDMNHDYSLALLVLAGATAAALVVGLWSAWQVTRSITGPLHSAVALAEAVAEGDLTTRIETDRTDEAGKLLHALRAMNDNLIRIVGGVRSGTQAIVTASDEINTGNLELSSRTENQAASLEETASSMEQLTATVRQNADNARQANTLAQSAADVAKQGGAVVAEVVVTMESINTAARKIVDIIAVIDSIAFQTNILALNAAVEAARAGEQGRGFAVVAGEVRNLAQRSAAAAKEIKDLIADSVGRVDTGSKLVNQAGDTMNEIIASIARVTDIMGEITAASSEQADGIGQVNQSIAQMDNATQQNAALVEESAAAAQALQNQAGELAKLVSVFKTGEPDTVDLLPVMDTAAFVAPVPAAPALSVRPGARDAGRPRIAGARRLAIVAGTGGGKHNDF